MTGAAQPSTGQPDVGELLVELFDDGGIRVDPPQGQGGITTCAALQKWVAVAQRTGWPTYLTGHVDSPLARAVIDQSPSDLSDVTIEQGEPRPWRRGWTSLMWAAYGGLVDHVRDVVDRGAPLTGPRPRQTPYLLAMYRGHVPVMAGLRAAGADRPQSATGVMPTSA